jgi:hypothetical protein
MLPPVKAYCLGLTVALKRCRAACEQAIARDSLFGYCPGGPEYGSYKLPDPSIPPPFHCRVQCGEGGPYGACQTGHCRLGILGNRSASGPGLRRGRQRRSQVRLQLCGLEFSVRCHFILQGTVHLEQSSGHGFRAGIKMSGLTGRSLATITCTRTYDQTRTTVMRPSLGRWDWTRRWKRIKTHTHATTAKRSSYPPRPL